MSEKVRNSLEGRLGAEMVRRGLNQAQFAKELGMSRPHLNQVLTGKVPVSKNLQYRIELLENERISDTSKQPYPRSESGVSGASGVRESTYKAGPESDIRHHMENLLSECAGETSRLHWVLEQLRMQLPLGRWGRQILETVKESGQSKELTEDEKYRKTYPLRSKPLPGSN